MSEISPISKVFQGQVLPLVSAPIIGADIDCIEMAGRPYVPPTPIDPYFTKVAQTEITVASDTYGLSISTSLNFIRAIYNSIQINPEGPFTVMNPYFYTILSKEDLPIKGSRSFYGCGDMFLISSSSISSIININNANLKRKYFKIEDGILRGKDAERGGFAFGNSTTNISPTATAQQTFTADPYLLVPAGTYVFTIYRLGGTINVSENS